ncbi:hypothetical protein C882_1148 [Caenispirillum salinarum AK4]|uniref:HTH lysR-type domain-containing protein n=1 Tax=Caenispirillum salinarum AK4 TaxID=1238182 RepID=K9GSP1_9PROT|nr:hypothetical protein C882_1148 [Caenispirillum salinarum AK4]
MAEELNFRRAAERLNLSQPPLSRQIQALENLVGARLFDRSPRSVALTPAGAAMVAPARAALAMLEDAVDLARAAGGPAVRRLVVGLTRVVDPSVFPDLETLLTGTEDGAGTVCETYGPSRALIEQLQDRRLDLALVAEPPECPPDLVMAPLFDEPMMVAIAETRLPPSAAGRLTFADLGDLPLFWFRRMDNPVLYDTAEAVFAAAGYAPSRRPKPPHRAALLNKVAAGEGVAFVPLSLEAVRRRGVAYRRLPPEVEARFRLSVHLAHRSDEARPHVLHAVRTLRDQLRDARADAIAS